MTIKGASAVLPALLFCSCAWAFEPAERPLMPLRGAAPHAQRPLFEGDRSDESGAKSPGKAFLLSLAIPGMGEFYAGAKKRAVGFVAVEALTWISYARWRSRGGDLRTEFRAFADRLWDGSRYRAWEALNRARGSPVHETHVLPCKEDVPDPGACERVDTQQYYEVIGKYDQFVYGWDDTKDLTLDTNNDQVQSTLRLDYEDQRNESNKLLKRASVIVGLAVLNRIVSAIHASFQAARSPYRADEAVSVQFGLMPAPWNGDLVPTVSLTTRLRIR